MMSGFEITSIILTSCQAQPIRQRGGGGLNWAHPLFRTHPPIHLGGGGSTKAPSQPASPGLLGVPKAG